MIIKKAYRMNRDIKFEVFIHKIDGLTEDNKIETQREIHQRSHDDLVDSGNKITKDLNCITILLYCYSLLFWIIILFYFFTFFLEINTKISISYHLTSIYDHSVFEAFSRVVQKMIPEYATLENFLNVIISVSCNFIYYISNSQPIPIGLLTCRTGTVLLWTLVKCPNQVFFTCIFI